MEVILTDKSLQGIHLTSRRKAFENQLLFSREDQLSKALDQAAKYGIKKIMCTTHPLLLRLLKKNARRWPLKVLAVVPNFSAFVRDTSHYGTSGAAIRKILQMPVLHKMRLGWVSFLHLNKIAKMKFEILMNLFLMAETSQFFAKKNDETSLEVDGIFLHPQIADLALLLKQSGLFGLFNDIVSNQFHSQAGVCTANFTKLQSFLSRHNLTFPWALAPFNSKGHLMHPEAKISEATLRETLSKKTKTIADHWRLSGHIPFEEGIPYLASLPFKAATLEFEDLLLPETATWVEKIQSL